MARKIKTSKTLDQRRAHAETLQATITEQVEALRDSETWARFCRFAQSFHRYSLGNVLLIQAQNPEATYVAGYRTWQQLGRQVRKGEHGISILGGRDIITTEEDDETGEEKHTHRIRFFPVAVFDISQTDLVDPDAVDPSTLAPRLTGDDPLGIVEAVTDWLTVKRWTVERTPIRGETNGYTTTDGSRRVVIDANLSPAQAAKTALHEAAHVMLHVEQTSTGTVMHRGIEETEAESVAYIVAGVLGLDTSAYSIGYVAAWSDCETDLIKSTAARVLHAAHTLADALTDTTSDTDAETA